MATLKACWRARRASPSRNSALSSSAYGIRTGADAPRGGLSLIVLALDTALAACSVGLFDTERDKVVASDTALLRRGHAEALVPMIERVIAKLEGGWTAVSRIGVVVGPGSFTGLRVGIAAAR